MLNPLRLAFEWISKPTAPAGLNAQQVVCLNQLTHRFLIDARALGTRVRHDAAMRGGLSAVEAPRWVDLTVHDARHVRVVSEDAVLPQNTEPPAVSSRPTRVLPKCVTLQADRETILDHFGGNISGITVQAEDESVLAVAVITVAVTIRAFRAIRGSKRKPLPLP